MVAAEKHSIFQSSWNFNRKSGDERGEENPSSQHGHTEERGLEVGKTIVFEDDVNVSNSHQARCCKEIDAFDRVGESKASKPQE